MVATGVSLGVAVLALWKGSRRGRKSEPGVQHGLRQQAAEAKGGPWRKKAKILP